MCSARETRCSQAHVHITHTPLGHVSNTCAVRPCDSTCNNRNMFMALNHDRKLMKRATLQQIAKSRVSQRHTAFTCSSPLDNKVHSIGHGVEMIMSGTHSREHVTRVPSCDAWVHNNVRHFNRTTPTKKNTTHHHLDPRNAQRKFMEPVCRFKPVRWSHSSCPRLFFFAKLEKTPFYCVNIYFLPHWKKHLFH